MPTFSIPDFGLGTWKIPKSDAESVVYESIKLGVRHLDCACDYGNEIEVGKGVAKAIKEGVVTRADLFITSKLWNTYHAAEHVEPAARKSLEDLGIAYFDLYLIHFPISLKFVPFTTRYPPEWIHDPNSSKPQMEVEFIPYSVTWKAMESLHRKGLAKFIGVSNLTVQGITEVWSYAEIKPVVNQVEMHPHLQQSLLLEFCQFLGVKVVAFSPLGSSSYVELGAVIAPGDSVMEEKEIRAIAATHNRTPAQIALRWNEQRGCAVITKSSNIARIAENLSISDFQLTEAEMSRISALDRGRRFNDPGVFARGMGMALPIYN